MGVGGGWTPETLAFRQALCHSAMPSVLDLSIEKGYFLFLTLEKQNGGPQKPPRRAVQLFSSFY